jgi:hypothetical protein
VSLNSFEYYNKISYSGQLINNRNILFTVTEAEKPEIKVTQIQFLVRACLLMMPSVLSHGRRKDKQSPLSFFYKALIPFSRAEFS